MKLFCVSSEMSSVFKEGKEYAAEFADGGCRVFSEYGSVFFASYNEDTGYLEVGSYNGNDLVELE